MEVRTTKRYLYLQGCIKMQKKPVLFWYYYSSKDYLKVKDLVIFAVAPHAGAWIEIMLYKRNFREDALSLPTRERGLKFICSNALLRYCLSLPTRERGLK